MYFTTLSAMWEFCESLRLKHEQVRCALCGKSKSFVRHDFVYKQPRNGPPVCVGKRLFCSPRSGRGGCGATLRLRPAGEVARLHYNTFQLTAFALTLIAGSAVDNAYCRATGALSSRNAFRWLQRLYRKLSVFRTYLGPRVGSDCCVARSPRLSVLLPTLGALLERTQEPSFAAFQVDCQTAAA